MKHLKPQKLLRKETKGVIELYKNNRRIRSFPFCERKQRRMYMKKMLQYSNTHLNNYYFIVKLNIDELL